MSVADSLRRTRRRLALFARSTIVAVVVLSPVARIASAEVAAIASSPNVFAVPDPNAALTFDGSAFGHGVGLCQWGSRGRAAAGQSVQQIIGAYYPGTAIQKVLAPETTIRVLVHSGLEIAADETERISALEIGRAHV